tara:strand:- start:557 stop:745 length:189 start_codon:yes stop_codon:yes gene_type:complete
MTRTTSWEHFFREKDMTLWVHLSGNPRHQIAMSVSIWAKKRYPQYTLNICSKETFERVKKEK